MTFAIEQALYGGPSISSYRLLGRSRGFADEWLPEAQRLCAGFGERPPGMACPPCVFARPLDAQHVAVVQVADQGADDAGRLGPLAFRLLALPRRAYEALGGDPFAVAERFPPSWWTRGELPPLEWEWPPESLPPRTVQDVQRVLQRTLEGPSLLGGAQALVDGSRLVFERPGPDEDLVRCLWTLLPTSTRCRLWPAGFAFGNRLGFDVLVVPRAAGPELSGYLNEDQAAEYPEGQYELSLQIAAEAGDQHALDALFRRRSRAETWRLGLTLLGLLMVVLVASNVLGPRPAPRLRPPAKLDLPAAAHSPTLSAPQRERLTESLRQLAVELGVQPVPAKAEDLVAAIDQRLGPTDHDPGKALTTGPVERRLRALLWKEGLAEYSDPRLNPAELVERLRTSTLADHAPPSGR
jgi:hypothetical protein